MPSTRNTQLPLQKEEVHANVHIQKLCVDKALEMQIDFVCSQNFPYPFIAYFHERKKFLSKSDLTGWRKAFLPSLITRSPRLLSRPT
ncbi:hypothetical protein TNCV_4148391 [Trichonephila clavipes]|nr:hypothetical protein TNCV_4148391 [Trichonephila clavipes]